MFLDLTTPNSTPYVVGQAGAIATGVIWKDATHAVCFFRSNMAIRPTGLFSHQSTMEVGYVTGVDVVGHKEVELIAGNFQDMDESDPAHIYMYEPRSHLVSVDITTGKDEIVGGSAGATELITDGYGRVVATIDVDRDLNSTSSWAIKRSCKSRPKVAAMSALSA